MSISPEAWQDIWNEGFQVGWNDRYHQSHAVTSAPSNASLCISKANWDAIYNAGFNAAYGKKTAAPSAASVPHDDAVCPPTQSIYTPVAVAASADRPLPTVYGQSYTQENFIIANALLNQGLKVRAPRLVMEAIIYAGMGESNLTYEAGNGGPLQTTCNYSAYNGGRDVGAQAYAWFTGGECFASGGGLHYGSVYDTAWQIANAVEENAVWSQRRGDSYARSGYSTEQLTAEAVYAVAFLVPGLGSPPPPTVTAPAPHNAKSVFDSYNWAGDYEVSWQRLNQAAWQAWQWAQAYYGRIVKQNYVKPNIFD